MFNKVIVLFLCSLTLLATSFCTQKNKKNRNLSSGGAAGDAVSFVDGKITIPAEIGDFILEKKDVTEPFETTYMTVKYRCNGSDKIGRYFNSDIVMITGSDRFTDAC